MRAVAGEIAVKNNQSSVTAMGIAFTRALESSRPADRRICYDPLARKFVSDAFYWFAKFWMDIGYAQWRGPGVFEFLAIRTRYIDDYLQSCLDDGLEQLVILGAGYDSRAYRFDGLKGWVKVFEVDHPATQQVKKAKLCKILGSLPEHVVFVPIDFTQESLETRLMESGYDPQLKTLFIWEGVTQYLDAQAVDDTLDFVAWHSGGGSGIIFDYMYTSALDGTRKRGEVASMRHSARVTGEQLRFGFAEGAVEELLSRHGFYHIVDADGPALGARYLTGPNQGRKVASAYAIAHATVRPRTADGRD
jgi:methyltransferase (TIGR00027 family)